ENVEREVKLTVIAGGVEKRAAMQAKLSEVERSMVTWIKREPLTWMTKKVKWLVAPLRKPQSKKHRRRARARMRKRLRKQFGVEEPLKPKQFRRRKLAYGLVMKCRRRKGNRPPRLDGKRLA
ncbi:hypothetical protein THAOC_08445, partial [Thalassiosira oceanica]